MQLADPKQVADLLAAIAAAEASTVAQTLLVGHAAPVFGNPKFWYCKVQLEIYGNGGWRCGVGGGRRQVSDEGWFQRMI